MPGGTRTLAAQLDNQGTLTASTPLVINKPSAVHTNSGTLDATAANVTLIQSGPTASFTNTGTITVGAGQTFAITGGTVNQNAGTIGGPGTVSLSTLTANFGTSISNAATALTVANSTINGPGTLTNVAGKTLTLVATAVNAPLVNQGTLVASGASAIGGAFTTGAGSTLRVAQVDGSSSVANLTVAGGFTNNGALELTIVTFAAAYSAQLTVPSGTLTNAVGATIAALPGSVPGGTRTLAAAVNNQGTIDVYPGTSGILAINGSLVTTGVLNFELGGLAAGSQYDRIVVTGTAVLGGTLNVGLINAFTPASLNSFTLITSTGLLSGSFPTTNLLGGLAPPTYTANSVTVSVP